MGEWEIPRIPLQYERAVLAGAVVREQPVAITVSAVRGRAYDVVAHQQAVMPEQLLTPAPADHESDGQERKPGRREALDLTALRVLGESRRDVEALDLTAERLRPLGAVFTAVADRARPPWTATPAGAMPRQSRCAGTTGREALRLHPPVRGIPAVAREGATLGGTPVRAGILIGCSPWAPTATPAGCPPPRRSAPNAGTPTPTPVPVTRSPVLSGSGPAAARRGCPGSRFAQAEITLVPATLAQRFRFR